MCWSVHWHLASHHWNQISGVFDNEGLLNSPRHLNGGRTRPGATSLCIWHTENAVIKDSWQLSSTCLLCKPPHLLCSEQTNPKNCLIFTNELKQKWHGGCKDNLQGPAKIHQKSGAPVPDHLTSMCGRQNRRKETDVQLTVGALFLGGSGKGRLHNLGVSAAPIAVISLSNMVLTVLLCTRVTCGGSLACMHVRMYCNNNDDDNNNKKNQTENRLSNVHI